MPRERKEKNIKKHQKKTFYSSTPKRNIPRKRDTENELIGIYKQGQWNFGFVDMVTPEGEKKWYYVHESKKLDAFEGDEVAFTTRFFREKEEATITKVLKRSEQLIVGKLQIGAKFAFVISDNPKVQKDIFIPGKHIWGYSNGSEVAVQIIKWEGKNPEWRIVESLNDLPKGREDIYKIAFEMWARKSFSDSVMSQVHGFSKNINPEDILGRRDLRNTLTYTIDGAESKDLDDAISILPLDKGEMSEGQRGWKLYVHIADVTHYTTENSHLDREARKRGTSIYLCDQVIPMLPAEISNGLCSLHPWEDKLTLTCEMHISSSGRVTKSEVYESIILSDYRLTYKEIDEMLSWDIGVSDELMFWEVVSEDLYKNIKNLESLTGILTKNTKERWALNFDFPETKIILDDLWNPVEYKRYERYNSYKIIEECMVLANESVAKLFSKYPFLYRVHEEPDPEDVDTFIKRLESMDAREFPSDFSTLLEVLKDDAKLAPFQKLLLRSLQKACYSDKNLGHFGLAIKHYSHFTSPIRRYPDLQIHRIIKEIINNNSQAKPHTIFSSRRNEAANWASLSSKEREFKSEVWSREVQKNGLSQARREHYTEILPKVAMSSSSLSDRAEKMEYRVRDMMACKYMSEKVGEQFTGKISWMIEKGFFIELENTIEWFISFEFTGYQFDSEKHCVVQSSTQKQLHFWDEVPVTLKSVDMPRYRLEFEMS